MLAIAFAATVEVLDKWLCEALFENCGNENLLKAINITGIWHGYLNSRRAPNSEACHLSTQAQVGLGTAVQTCSSNVSLQSSSIHVLPFFPFSWDKTAAGNVQIV